LRDCLNWAVFGNTYVYKSSPNSWTTFFLR
jgi:hypothetical protein